MSTVESIIETLGKNNISTEEKEVSEMLSMIRKMNVDEKSAKTMVINQFAKKAGIEISSSARIIAENVAEIQQMKGDEWIDVTLCCKKLFETNHENIAQKGYVGDSTGIIVMTVWETANAPLIEEDQTYSIKNAVLSEYNGEIQISVNKSSEIIPVNGEEEIDTSSVKTTEEIVGVVKSIKKGSGLVKRCPECNKTLYKGKCKDHGTIEGHFDLRVMGIIDDGKKETSFVMTRALAEEKTGMSLDEAISIAMDTLQPETINEAQKELFVGRYVKATVQMSSSNTKNTCDIEIIA